MNIYFVYKVLTNRIGALIIAAGYIEVRQYHVILDGPSFFNINCHSKIGNLL